MSYSQLNHIQTAEGTDVFRQKVFRGPVASRTVRPRRLVGRVEWETVAHRHELMEKLANIRYALKAEGVCIRERLH
jgi:hypothetical protein